MINYTVAKNQKDLEGILSLQKANLAMHLSHDEIRSQGFVTVDHSFADLKKLNDIEQHVIGISGDKVIAYLLAMTEASKNDIPVLIPMFEQFSKLSFAGKKISSYHYIVVGQVCVDKDHRGKNVIDNCYAFYKQHFEKKYDFAITEIATSNTRSLKAHQRIGFREIHRFTDTVEWSIVLWDWKNLQQL